MDMIFITRDKTVKTTDILDTITYGLISSHK